MRIKVKVQNYDGGADNSEIWINRWEETMRRSAEICSNTACSCPDNLVGAHVVKCSETDGTTYIVPLCRSCNALSPEHIFTVFADDMMTL